MGAALRCEVLRVVRLRCCLLLRPLARPRVRFW